MKLKALLALSLGANVLLLGLACYLAKIQPGKERGSLNPAAASKTVSTPPGQQATTITRTVTNQAVQTIDWRSVESEDYKKYITNLRGIGCPEETIRDIITADVNKLFDARKKTLSAASTNKFQFWKTGMQMFAQAFDEDKLKQQHELANERRTLLTELLGSAPEEKPDLAAAMGSANILESMLDFLPSSKQTAVLEVLQKYQGKIMKNMGSGGLDGDSMKDVAKIQREMEAELGKILTPAELDDYNLRMSNTANMMRFQLASFEPNEQEFRDVFKQRKAFDDQFGSFGTRPTDKAEGEKYDAAKKELDAKLKEVLGGRYGDFERAQDYSYQSLYAVGQRNGVAKEALVQAYELKKPAEEEANKIRANNALSPEQRDTALQGIRDETERSLRAELGDKAFDSYQKNPGSFWLKNIGGKKQ